MCGADRGRARADGLMSIVVATAAYEHVAVVHDGPDELASQLAAPVREGLASGDRVLVCLDPPAWECLATRIGPLASEAVVVPPGAGYQTPGAAMSTLHRFVDESLAGGASTAWAIGSLPLDGSDDDDRWWRYEQAVDAVLGHRPLHAICSYDLTTATPAHLAAARHTHDRVAGSVGAVEVVDSAVEGVAGPVLPKSPVTPAGPPTVVLAADDVGGMRRDLVAACGELSEARRTELALLASELVTNGICHGRPPVLVRAWSLPREIVVEVSDGGDGIGDAYADLRLPHGGSDGGFGLWLVGQVAHRLTFGREGGRNVITASLRR